MLVYCDEHFFVGKNSRIFKTLPRVFYDTRNNITKEIKREKKRYTKEELYHQISLINNRKGIK